MAKNIIKRDGTLEEFNEEKIYRALKKAFVSIDEIFEEEEIVKLKNIIVKQIYGDSVSVEEVQNLAEETLMKQGYYNVARHYIVYRGEQSKKRQYRYEIANIVPSYNLYKTLKFIQKDYPSDDYSLVKLLNKYKTYVKFKMEEQEKMHCLIRAALDLVSIEYPDWDFIAARLFMVNFYTEIRDNLKKYDLGSFAKRLKLYCEKFRYDRKLLSYYDADAIALLEKNINRLRDKFLNYSTINTFMNLYLIKLGEFDYIQSVQELFMIVAMIIGMKENQSVEEVISIYNALSKRELNESNSQVATALKSIAL